MKKYATLVCCKGPSNIEHQLNNYADAGWKLKCAMPYKDGSFGEKVILIFEAERES